MPCACFRIRPDLGLPLVVTEFAHAGVGRSRFIDYKTIVAEAGEQNVRVVGLGVLGSAKDCEEMDMTTHGHFDTLQARELEVAMTEPHSIHRPSRNPESIDRGRCARRIEEAGR